MEYWNDVEDKKTNLPAVAMCDSIAASRRAWRWQAGILLNPFSTIPQFQYSNCERSELSRSFLEGTYWIAINILYGAGLRMIECIRVKDVVDRDMYRGQIFWTCAVSIYSVLSMSRRGGFTPPAKSIRAG